MPHSTREQAYGTDSQKFGQDFGLDHLNNWSMFDEDPDGTGMSNLSQSRDHNLANEIEEIDSASTYVSHDAAGNMTTVPKPGSGMTVWLSPGTPGTVWRAFQSTKR